MRYKPAAVAEPFVVPTSRGPRYETLDVWRGVACLSVIIFHSTFGYVVTPESKVAVLTNGGTVLERLATATAYLWVGVPLFFVISGYCIAASAVAARRRPNPVGRFFARRFRRIYPPLWAFLTLTAVGVWLLPEHAMPGPHHGTDRPLPYPYELGWVNWLGSITLTEEWRHQLGGPPRGYLAGQLWTLCYEEQFYLIAGLLLVARRWFFAGVAVVSVVVLLNLTPLPTVGGFDPNRLRCPLGGFFFDGYWLAFAAGVAVYYRVNNATGSGRFGVDLLLAAGVFTALGRVPNWVEFPQGVPAGLAAAFAFALALGWLHWWDAVGGSARLLAPLRYCGRMCYSLYLVHGPVVTVLKWNLYCLGVTASAGTLFVTVPVCVAASVASGALFHRWVERRFANSPTRSEPARGAEPPAVNSPGVSSTVPPLE